MTREKIDGATRRHDRAGGYTLIELLVVMAILSVIAIPLGILITDVLLNSRTTSARLNEAHDQQLVSTYWPQDVASMGLRGAWDTTSQSFPASSSVNVYNCASPTPSSSFPNWTRVISLSWNSYDSSGNATVQTVTYGTVGSAGQQLVRVSCTGTTSLSTTGTAVIADSLAATPTCSFNGGSATTCSTWTASTPPSSIGLTLSIIDNSQHGASTSFSTTIAGSRRQT